MDWPAEVAPRDLQTEAWEGRDAAERFPFTKFQAPAVDSRVAGARVAQLAQALRGHRIVVVCAPAGSGKTTLLATWAAAAEGLVAWLRVDDGDDGADILAAALHGAVARVAPSLGRRLPTVLAGRGPARTPRALASALINDLADVPEIVIALDDLHAVGAEAAPLLALLVDLLPPHVRLLAATRTVPPLPVARLRVRGELAELDASDLQLDLEEVRRILALQGPTDDATAQRVLAMSGGWAAAVRLATAALPVDGADADAGVHAGASAPFHDELWAYLAEEVLHEQPPLLRAFLLETSILDELRVEVCAAVTGRADAADFLRELEARHLFVARFARPEGTVWRYHDLFVTFLRDRLVRERDATSIAELHRRAAAALPHVPALPHLIAAGDAEAAGDRIAEALFTTYDGSLLPHLVPWLDRLPPELVERDPRLTMIRAWHFDVAGRSHEARAAVEPLWRRLVAEGRHDEGIDLGIQLVGSLLSVGDLDAVDEVLALVDRPDLDPTRRVIVLMTRVWRDWNRRDTVAMSVGLERALDLALQDGAPSANVVVPSLTSLLLFVDRGPAWLLDQAQRLEAILTPHDDTVRLQLRTLAAAAALLRLDLDGTESELRSVLAASDALGRIAWTHQDSEALLIALLLMQGEREAVIKSVDAALEARPSSPIYDRWWPAYAYPALRASTPTRSCHALRALVARYLPEELCDASPNDAIVRGMAEAWLAVAGGAASDAREPLSALAEAERVQHATRAYLGHGLPGLERGSLLLAAGRATAALDAAEPTLDAAARFGAGILLTEVEPHRPLLTRCAGAGLGADLIGAVFAAVDSAHASGRTLEIPGSGESLTAREVDVLRLVADGRSNRDIAEALGISEATVKTHMTRVLSKLGATSRTHAVARAREFYLL